MNPHFAIQLTNHTFFTLEGKSVVRHYNNSRNIYLSNCEPLVGDDLSLKVIFNGPKDSFQPEHMDCLIRETKDKNYYYDEYEQRAHTKSDIALRRVRKRILARVKKRMDDFFVGKEFWLYEICDSIYLLNGKKEKTYDHKLGQAADGEENQQGN